MFTLPVRLKDRCASADNGRCDTLLLRRRVRACVLLFLCVWTAVPRAGAAEYSTSNFRVTAADKRIARDVALRAEELRTEVSLDWLGRELETWTDQCRIVVDTNSSRLFGDTTYVLVRGEVRRWRMDLRGEPQRILDVLLPHEIVHTVLASHFRCPIPRWADEGAALSAEDVRERDRLWKLESPRLLADDRLPLRALLTAEEYPEDRGQVRAFYVQGGSLTEFLLSAGKPEFVEFVAAGMRDGWDAAVLRHYGFSSVARLEAAWQDWIVRDRPQISLSGDQLLMSACDPDRGRSTPVPVATNGATRLVARDARVSASGGGQ